MPDDSDYYQGGEDTAAPDQTGDAPDTETPEKQSEDDSNSALVPKTLFKDMPAVGAEVTFRVVHIYDDEVELEAMNSGNEKKDKTPAMDDATDKLGSMAEMNGAATA